MHFEETPSAAPSEGGLFKGAQGMSSELQSSDMISSDSEGDSTVVDDEWTKRPDKKIIRMVISFIKNFFYDLLFLAFIAT